MEHFYFNQTTSQPTLMRQEYRKTPLLILCASGCHLHCCSSPLCVYCIEQCKSHWTHHKSIRTPHWSLGYRGLIRKRTTPLATTTERLPFRLPDPRPLHCARPYGECEFGWKDDDDVPRGLWPECNCAGIDFQFHLSLFVLLCTKYRIITATIFITPSSGHARPESCFRSCK